jgi:hypothetical protein
MSDAGEKMTVGFTAPVVAGATAAVNSYGNVDKQFNLVKQTMGSTANSASDFKGSGTRSESLRNRLYLACRMRQTRH